VKVALIIRAGEPLPTQIEWTRVDRLEIRGSILDRTTMPGLLAQALAHNVRITASDPAVFKEIDRLSL
jgi:hypothetical protein